jgi:Fe-S-cluster containining protein
MKELPCHKCPGLCCGPVPLSSRRLKAIEAHLHSLKDDEYQRLALQERDNLMCSFYDTERHRCGVYEARPQICRIFGHTESLECPRQPSNWVFTIQPVTAWTLAELDTVDVALISTEYKWHQTQVEETHYDHHCATATSQR